MKGLVVTHLWKIGSSVVMTVPFNVVKGLDICGVERRILTVLVERPFSFSFLARPWRCGGSYVVTVPSSCVQVFDLKKVLKKNDDITVNFAIAGDKVG